MANSVTATDHAKWRWFTRLAKIDALHVWPSTPIRKAWREGTPVAAPQADCDAARVYPIPEYRDMLLVAHETPGGLEIRTVLYADPWRLEPVDAEAERGVI